MRPTRSSTHSSRRRRAGLGWGCRSVAPSSRRTAGDCGPRRTTDRAQRFISHCRLPPDLTVDPEDSLVLVVDDDPSVREALHSLIRSAGLSCQAFGSAADLLAFARPDAPACLVADVQLPGTS